jgi:hypothetical protein
MFQLTRKADRKALAARIASTVEQHGATVTIRDRSDSLYISIELDGVSASCGLWGDRRMQDCVIVNWSSGRGREFSSNFGCAARTYRNDWKAPVYAHDAEELVDSIDGGFGAVRCGAALKPGGRETANPFEIAARLRRLADAANFPLDRLSENFFAWSKRDGEASALELLDAKEAEFGIAA